MKTNSFHWNSKKIADDLAKIKNVAQVIIEDPGGDYDTDNIFIDVKKGDGIIVSAYQYEHDDPPPSPSDVDVHYVSIEDGLDSRGGLNSRKKNTALVFVQVRQYFIDQEACIINHYDEIF